MDDVAALKGGWAAWLRAGYPIEGTQVALPTPPVKETSQEVSALGDPKAPVTILEFSDYQ